MINQYEHPGLGQIRQPRPGAKLSRSDMRKEPIAPALREHSEEILVEFEFSAAEIKERVDKGVVMNASLDNR
ncbi:MAG: hypothetical protein ACNYPE_07140 [Candidatus Azotimanducaceae bacterium WSBS_2022_MAG_OTU7]